jgi:hypothetical protein
LEVRIAGASRAAPVEMQMYGVELTGTILPKDKQNPLNDFYQQERNVIEFG